MHYTLKEHTILPCVRIRVSRVRDHSKVGVNVLPFVGTRERVVGHGNET